MEISSAVPEAAADPAAVKAGRETSAGAGVFTPNECPTSGSQTASAGNRSGIPRLITKNGEYAMAEVASFEEPPAAAGRVIKEAVRNIFGKVSKYTALPWHQALINVNKTGLTDTDEIEEAHGKFCEALDGTGWKLDRMIVDDPKYLEFGPLNVMIIVTYTGSAGPNPAA